MERTKYLSARISILGAFMAFILLCVTWAFAPSAAWADEVTDPVSGDVPAAQTGDTPVDADNPESDADASQPPAAVDEDAVEGDTSADDAVEEGVTEGEEPAKGEPAGDVIIEDVEDEGEAAPAAPEPKKDAEADKDVQLQDPTPYTPPISDGDYYIESSKNLNQVIDAANGSNSNYTNVQTYTSNGTNAQKWNFKYDSLTGYYTITTGNGGAVLDVSGGNASKGANVQLYQSNGTKAQQWRVVAKNGGYIIVSALNSDLVLDLANGGTSNYTNVQLWSANGSAAQLFYLLKVANVGPGVEIAEGTYTFVAGSSDGKYVVDIRNGSSDDGAAAQLWSSNGSSAQAFYLKSDNNGYYYIQGIGSSKCLQPAGGSVVPGTDVIQSSYSAKNPIQKWAFTKNSDGSYKITNKATGLVLDVYCGSISNGTKLTIYSSNGSKAQKFFLKAKSTGVSGTSVTGLGGTYYIEATNNYLQVLDASNGSSSNYTNIQSYESNGSKAQQWTLTEVKTGYYTIAFNGKKTVYDVSSARLSDGTNVQLYESNGTDAQLWRIIKKGDSYVFVSALRNNLVLDLSNGGKTSGTNVQVYSYNGSAAQKFQLVKATPIAAGATVTEGAYTMTIGSATGSKALDISGATTSAGGTIQAYDANATAAQRFYFSKDSKGYYTITAICSGMTFQTANGGVVRDVQVLQGASTSADSAKWSLVANEDGSYSLRNKATGLYLSLASGETVENYDITKLSVSKNDTKSNFFLTATALVSDGIYKISQLKNDQNVLDITNGSADSGAAVQIYSSNNTLAQRFQVVYDSAAQTYRIRTGASGGWLTASDSKVVQKGNSTSAATAANTWVTVWNGGFYSFKNVATGTVLTYDGSSVYLSKASSSSKQQFLFTAAQLIKDGAYELKTVSKKNMDIANGSMSAGANVQIYDDNSSAAQRFYLTYGENGYVIRVSSNSSLVVGVANNSTDAGANVQLAKESSSSLAQRWVAQIADGGYVTFVNAKSGMALNAASYSKSGSNVNQDTPNGSKAQLWKLDVASGYWTRVSEGWRYFYDNGDSAVFDSSAKRAYDLVQGKTSQTNWLCAIDNSYFHVTIFKRGASGNWEPVYNWLCGVGSPTLGLTFRGESYIMKKGEVMGEDPQEYWWSEFFNNGADPTGEGQRFHSILYWAGSNRQAVYEDGRGGANSHGCVRLLIEQSKWIYDNIPFYTKVYSYD